MVTKLENLGKAPTTRNNNLGAPQRTDPRPAFPMSSPQHENLTAFKPVSGRSPMAEPDAFLSPNPFMSGSSDDESGSSSGQDEFHLERYSQDNNGNLRPSQSHQKRSTRQPQRRPTLDKKTRPGLNIITDFSSRTKRSKTDGLVLDQVQAQRPQLGPRYATSIKSAKAEQLRNSGLHSPPAMEYHHVEESKRALARQAISRLKDSSAARRNEKQRPVAADPMQLVQASVADRGQSQEPTSTTSARSIVIGISVPESEVDARRTTVNSAFSHTPDTPAIVVTPAEETEDWKPLALRQARPASSIYSAYPPNFSQPHLATLPPVPRIPRIHTQDTRRQQASDIGARASDCRHDHADPYAVNIEDEQDWMSATDPPRRSDESQERIMPPDAEVARHKSQGWWNLMLSPMLSRKGTIVDKSHDQSPDTPPVPAIPAGVRLSKSDVVSPLDDESPGTPRRAGLASARASVWSRWTTWEKQRDASRSDPANEHSLHPELPRDMTQTSSNTQSLLQIDQTKGLAAEYYHACAVEQLTGVAYFECQGHSCAEKLPQLQSIFDKEVSNTIANHKKDEAVGGAPSASSPRLIVAGAGSMQSPQAVARGTSFQSEPVVLSPNVRQADTAAVVKAKSVETPSSTPQTRSEQENSTQVDEPHTTALAITGRQVPEYPATKTAAPTNLQPPVLSPGPVSPAMDRSMASEGAVAMSEVHHYHTSPHMPVQTTGMGQQQTSLETPPYTNFVHNNAYHARDPFRDNQVGIQKAREDAMQRLESVQTTREIDSPPQRKKAQPETSKESKESPREEKEKTSIWSKLWKVKNLFAKGPGADATAQEQKKNRRWTILVSTILLSIVIACILLATLLTRSGNGTPVQSQWLNLTGYPPIPTGISTIARPDMVNQQSSCVSPSSMWSCALPEEDQFEIVPNDPDQPNFRFQIAFRNGTVPSNMTVPLQSQKTKRASDPFTNDLFTPNPSAPSRADQIFIGNSTDNVTQPFDGEQTPFFITFIPVFPIDPSNTTTDDANFASNRRLRRQQTSNSSNTGIPDPDVLDDGSAAPANLLPVDPFPFSQPMKLYNRGQQDEHYGFYMYYDKAIFLHSTAPLNISATPEEANDPLDDNGGSTRDQAQLRCTFSQTRFLVQMWTNPSFGARLLPEIADGSNATSNPNTNSSATDFSRPGSFPYPTTITLDRHGGNINKKLVYCYQVTPLQVLIPDSGVIVAELRDFGNSGGLVNPAPTLVNGTAGDIGDEGDFNQNAGGIDGGRGGCECSWQNWS